MSVVKYKQHAYIYFNVPRQDLAADESEGEEEAPSSLRNVNQDMQRALGALGTAEAAEAFRAGQLNHKAMPCCPNECSCIVDMHLMTLSVEDVCVQAP